MELLNEKVFCTSCNRKTNHKIIHCHKVVYDLRTFGKFTGHYIIISCAGCDNISFAKTFQGEDNKRKITVYPEEPKVYISRHPQIWSQIESSVPVNIKELYNQVIYSYNQNHTILCALGLRTLIEAVCNELNIKKGYKHDTDGLPITSQGKKESIEGRIYGLYEEKYIIWNQTIVLQRIREIGNAATHDLIIPTTDEINGAIAIVETLISNIFELKNHSLLKNE